MKSERVIVQVAGADDWRGDDLRFRAGSGDAHVRLNDLDRSYRHITALRVVPSEDEPTHSYSLDGTLRRMADAKPPGFRETVDMPSMPVELPHPKEERRVSWVFVLAVFAAGAWLVVWMRNFQVP